MLEPAQGCDDFHPAPCWREQRLRVLLTSCGAELCGPPLACGGTNPVALSIWDTPQGGTALCWQLCPQAPSSEGLQSSELFVLCAAAEPSEGCAALRRAGHRPWSPALLLVGQLSPGLVPPLPLPAHDRSNRRRDCFSRSCCLDPWCSGRLRADPGAVEPPRSPVPPQLRFLPGCGGIQPLNHFH